MEYIDKEQISISTEKKMWAMPELIVIDKKVIESGIQKKGCVEDDGSSYCDMS